LYSGAGELDFIAAEAEVRRAPRAHSDTG
jgi:hypothetical protein